MIHQKGRDINWNEIEKRFESSCRGGKFNRSGEVLEGSPPRPLDLFKLMSLGATEGGRIARENALRSCTRCHKAHVGKMEHIALARKGLLPYP